MLIRDARGGGRARRDQDGPPGMDRSAPANQGGLLHAHQQQRTAARSGCRGSNAANPRAGQHVRSHHSLARGRRRPGVAAAPMGHLRSGGRSAASGCRTSAAISRATRSASPDGLWFDDGGILWIQTDVSTSTLGKGDYAAARQQHDAGGRLRRPARSVASSPGRAVARLPESSPRRTADRCSSTSSILASRQASAPIRRAPQPSARGPMGPPAAGRAQPRLSFAAKITA